MNYLCILLSHIAVLNADLVWNKPDKFPVCDAIHKVANTGDMQKSKIN